MKKKVSGSSNVSEVETEGLREHGQGTEQGRGVNKPPKNAPGQPNIVSQDKSPYPNQRTVRNPNWGDIENQVSSDDRAVKKFRDEQ